MESNSKIKILILSHKRADRVKTKKAIANTILCVPESQAGEYKEHNPELEIITHPDTVIGLNAKRQWCIDNFPEVFMVDDDIDNVKKKYVEFGDGKQTLTAEQSYSVIQNLYNVAKQIGIHLFGFGRVLRPRIYDEFRPIKLTGYVTGSNMGVIADGKIGFPDEFVLVEDYYASLINAFYNRMALIDTRFYINQKDTFVNSGGLSAIRNLKTEREANLKLKKYFGDAVNLKRQKTLFKHTNQYERTMTLPF